MTDTPTYKTQARDTRGNILVGVGDLFEWETLGGPTYRGRIADMDSNIAFVNLHDANGRETNNTLSVEL